MTKMQENTNKIIFSSDFGKSSKRKLNFLKGKIADIRYGYSSGDCCFELTYEDGRKSEILANDLGFQITKC